MDKSLGMRAADLGGGSIIVVRIVVRAVLGCLRNISMRVSP